MAVTVVEETDGMDEVHMTDLEAAKGIRKMMKGHLFEVSSADSLVGIGLVESGMKFLDVASASLVLLKTEGVW